MKKIILLIIVLLPINVFALDNVDTRYVMNQIKNIQLIMQIMKVIN